MYFSPYAKILLTNWSVEKVVSGQQSMPSVVSEETNFEHFTITVLTISNIFNLKQSPPRGVPNRFLPKILFFSELEPIQNFRTLG